jgi:hypothetical protein
MARVTIDSGPVTADLYLRKVPREKWQILLLERRSFLHTHLPFDCRELLRFVEDAEQMYAVLGYASVEDLVRRGLDLDPQQVGWAVEGLRQLKPNEPITYEWAQKLGKHGGDRKSEAVKDQGSNTTLKLPGRGAAYILARLDRDGHAELAAKVRTGKISANAAAIEAGFRQQKTPLERVRAVFRKMTRTELRQARLDIDQMLGDDKAAPAGPGQPHGLLRARGDILKCTTRCSAAAAAHALIHNWYTTDTYFA